MKIDIFKSNIKLILIIFMVFFSIIPSLFYKKIFINIDGDVHELRTTTLFTSNLKFDDSIGDVLIGSNSIFVHHNQIIEADSKKELEIEFQGDVFNFITYTNSYTDLVSEIVAEYDLEVDETISYIFIDKSVPLKDVEKLTLHTLTKVYTSQVEDVGIIVERKEDPILSVGYERIVQEGTPISYLREYESIYIDGEFYTNVLLKSTVINDGQPTIIEYGTLTIEEAIEGDTVWDDLAQCESGGRWNLNTGNGFYGGLQFLHSTWITASNKVGLGHIEYAHQATREEQIMAAEWLVKAAKSGFGQWPACSRKLGLIS